MTDSERKNWIRSARIRLRRQNVIIERYARRIIDLELEVERLRRRLEPCAALQESISSARLDEMDCEQFNLD